MADVISRLRLDSGEFDSKIKRAGQELLAYSEHCKKMGLEMGYANKDAKDFAKALGDMNTVSQTARGKLNELTEAFVNLKAMYNNMTDAEKQNTFGKELAASLDKLKNRIDEAKQNLNSVNAELGNTKQAEDGAKSGLEGLTSALGINVKSLAGWGAALTAGKVALDVAKDAFFANESTVDDWGRTVESAKGIYEGFLQSLNTGDISGFLNNISQITAAAREAYNALDELGTRQTILNPERAKLQARSTELKAIIRREGANSAAGKAAAAELKALEKPLTEAWKTESKLNRDAFTALVKERLAEGGINLNQKSFNQFMKTFSSDAAFQNLRKNAKGSIGMEYTGGGSYDEGSVKKVDTRNVEQKLLDLFTDEWRKKNIGYLTAAYNAEGSAASTMLSDARYLKGGGSGKSETTTSQKSAKEEELIPEGSMADLQKKMSDLKKEQSKVTDPTDWQIYASLIADVTAKMDELQGKTKQAAPDMKLSKSAQADLNFTTGATNFDTINTYINALKGQLNDADLGSELYNSLTEKLKDATTVSTLLQEMMERGLEGADLETTAQALKEKLLSPEGIDQTAIQSFLDTLNAQIEEAGGVGLKLNEATGEVTDDKGKGKDDGEEFKKFNEGVGKLTGGLSSVTSGLKAVGVDIPKEVDQVVGVINGVSQVISGIGTLISLFGAGAMTANTTAVSLNTAAIGGLIAAIEFNTASNFIPFFANGGIVPHAANGYFVPGNNFSGDTTPILANAGELVLSKSQQGVLASMLTDEERGGGNAQPYLDGEKIYLGLQAYMRRSGLGEIVTSER